MNYLFLKKLLIFTIGLFIMSFGVVFSVQAHLGISPISCAPYIYSEVFPLSLGQTTIIINAILIMGQILILGKKYKLFQLIQFPIIFVFGFFIDLAVLLCHGFSVETYIGRTLLCVMSCFLIAFGVYLEMKGNLTFLPGEGLALALSERFGLEFSKAKIVCDSALVVFGIVSSFFFLKKLIGIREGTIIAALLVGTIVRFYNKIFPFFEQLVFTSTIKKNATTGNQEKELSYVTLTDRENGNLEKSLEELQH